MVVLAIIPARGGSKAIPNKNIVPLLGKPLIGYTCEAARACRLVGRTILSTDNEQIAAVGRSYGVEVPFMRPGELSQDDTPMLAVLDHALSWIEKEEGYRADIVVLLQATSPLRRAEHIDQAIDLLTSSGADTVVSVVEVPHQFGPASVMTLDETGSLKPYLERSLVLRRQDKPKVYARNGPAVLVMKRQSLAEGRLYGNAVKPYEMALADSVDIDGPDDLAMAEFWLRRR